MGTAERTREQERGRRGRRTARRGSRRPGRAELGPAEKRRLAQLVICLALFLAVFVGRGVFPQRMDELRGELLDAIHGDTDFRAAFSALGRAVSEGKPFTQAMAALWGVEPEPVTDGEGEPLYAHQAALLTGLIREPEGEEGLWTDALALTLGGPPAREPEPAPTPTPEPSPAPEPAVEHLPYDGPTLPDNATMDKYNLSALGVGETVTPALGWVSSPFGWREHPVDGEERFHNGVDLAVNTGTAVKAFAAGTVDYIGESDSYGLYLQLRHAGGLTSFYCHCDKLCVQQGQVVAAGEKVAESGATGNATGPHLHFEMKLDGVLLNPLYYIETQ